MTLIEILIVVILIGMTAAFVTPSIDGTAALFPDHGATSCAAATSRSIPRASISRRSGRSSCRISDGRASAHSLAWRGSVKVNTDPRPISLDAVMSPPSARAMSRLIASPNPTPSSAPAL